MSFTEKHIEHFLDEVKVEVKKFHHRHLKKETFFKRLKNHIDIWGLDIEEDIIESKDIIPKVAIAIEGVLSDN